MGPHQSEKLLYSKGYHQLNKETHSLKIKFLRIIQGQRYLVSRIYKELNSECLENTILKWGLDFISIVKEIYMGLKRCFSI